MKKLTLILIILTALLIISGPLATLTGAQAPAEKIPDTYPFPTTGIQTDLIMACRITTSATARVAGTYQYRLEDYDAVIAAVFNELRVIRANNEQ